MLNTGLFRFCAAVLIVHWVHLLVRGLMLHIMSGDTFLYPLEPLLLILGPLIPIAFVVLSLVKKSARILKIVSALCTLIYAYSESMRLYNLLTVTMPHYSLTHLSATYFVVRNVLDIFLNTSLVVYIAAFFTTSTWRIEEFREKLNLPLLRVLAVIFAVWGLGDVAGSILGYLEACPSAVNAMFPWRDVFFSSLSLTVGIYALVKRNSFVLKVYALLELAVYFWRGAVAMFGLPGASSVAVLLVDMLFNTVLVFYVAVFFVESEKNRLYLQRLKSLFLKWKNFS